MLSLSRKEAFGKNWDCVASLQQGDGIVCLVFYTRSLKYLNTTFNYIKDLFDKDKSLYKLKRINELVLNGNRKQKILFLDVVMPSMKKRFSNKSIINVSKNYYELTDEFLDIQIKIIMIIYSKHFTNFFD